MLHRLLISFFLFFAIAFNLHASNLDTTIVSLDSSITVSEFLVNGNKRTKPSIILREIDLLKGESWQ